MFLTACTVNHCMTQFSTLVFLRERWDGDHLETRARKRRIDVVFTLESRYFNY